MKQHVLFWIWDLAALTNYLHSHEDQLEFWRCCCRRSPPARAVTGAPGRREQEGKMMGKMGVHWRRPFAQITSPSAALWCNSGVGHYQDLQQNSALESERKVDSNHKGIILEFSPLWCALAEESGAVQSPEALHFAGKMKIFLMLQQEMQKYFKESDYNTKRRK